MVSGVRDPGRRGRWRKSAAVSAAALTVPFVWFGTTERATAADDCSPVAWMDHTRSPQSRAAALLDASSQHQIYRWLVEQPANSPQQTDVLRGHLPRAGRVHAHRRLHGRTRRRAVHRRRHRVPRSDRGGVDVEHRPGRAEGRGAGRRGLRQGQERRARPGTRRAGARRSPAAPPSTSARTRCSPASSPPPPSTASRTATPTSR